MCILVLCRHSLSFLEYQQSSLRQAIGWRLGSSLRQALGAVGSGEGSFSAPEVSEGSCGRGFLCRHNSGGLSQASRWYVVSHFHRVSPADPSLGGASGGLHSSSVCSWQEQRYRRLLDSFSPHSIKGRALKEEFWALRRKGAVEPGPPSPGVFQLHVCGNKGVRRVGAVHQPLHLEPFYGCVRVSDEDRSVSPPLGAEERLDGGH